MRVLIISGGTKPSKELLLKEAEKSDYIIAADRGLQYLYEENIKPNYILGDFDSIDLDVLEEIKTKNPELDIFPREKDYTDTELAVRKALELKPCKIVMLGVTGTRLDHVMGNLGMLNLCLENGVKATIKDDNNTIFLINKEIILEGKCGQTFSLQAYEGMVEKLCISKAKYELCDYNLKVGEPLTISNEFLVEKVKIGFSKGKILVFYSRD